MSILMKHKDYVADIVWRDICDNVSEATNLIRKDMYKCLNDKLSSKCIASCQDRNFDAVTMGSTRNVWLRVISKTNNLNYEI